MDYSSKAYLSMLKRLDQRKLASITIADSGLPDASLSSLSGSTGSDEPNLKMESHLENDSTEAVWMRPESQAFLISFMLHLALLLTLALLPVVSQLKIVQSIIIAKVPEEVEQVLTIDQVAVAEQPSAQVGANSDGTASSMALSSAPVLADLSEIPSPTSYEPVADAKYAINHTLQQAVGLVRSQQVTKGMTGVGEQGINGAVDRVTYEILRSMEESPTLVVWFFDQSGSLTRQREEVRNRFDKIYEELGIVAQSMDAKEQKLSDHRLLTAVIAFGQQVQVVTQKPTADIATIRQAIDSIENDPSGIENVFTALGTGLDQFRPYASARSGRGQARSILFVVVTDERGDDSQLLDSTISDCRKLAIPVYVLGVPAPFGRDVAFVKYVDPNPDYDQTPQWGQVDQGPESIMPERVRLGYKENELDEPVVDSGFGPFSLSRLAYETGGIYFAIHPNRQTKRRVRRQQIEAFASDIEYFFDPEVIDKYRPEYVSQSEYMKRVQSSPLRSALIQTSQLSKAAVLDSVTTRFIKRDEASLVSSLAVAQQSAARVAPDLERLSELLKTGLMHRDKEVSPRWLASFDLSLGSVLANKVRAATYNEMLAQARRGMKFQTEKSNTWILKPDSKIDINSRLEKEGQQAVELLRGVMKNHSGTPWGMLAERELANPIGWKWVEEYTDLNPRPREDANPPLTPPPPPQDDQRRMLAPPLPKRPLPKL